MSFDVNVLRTKPMIREAANMNNDGGGGNLGYMQQSRDGTKDRQKRLDESIFGKKEDDMFINEKDLEFVEEGFSITKWLKQMVSSILKIFTSRRNP